jgi:cell division protein FtsW
VPDWVSTLNGVVFSVYMQSTRYILPLLMILILWRCFRSMLRERYEPETWAYVERNDGSRVALRNWENLLGRSKISDVVINDPTISRNHACLVRNDQGQWTLYDLGSKGGTTVASEPVPPEGKAIWDNDCFALGGIEHRFLDLNEEEREILAQRRTAPGWAVHPGTTFLILTIFQVLLTLQHVITAQEEYRFPIAMAFVAMATTQWLYYLVMRSIRRTGFEVETLAFLLSTIGMSVAASSVPESMLKQTILTLAGVGLFIFLGWWLRDLNRVKRFRWLAAGAALVALAVNLVLSEAIFGAKNWLMIGGVSIQPSEFVKIAFIYAGAATLDRLFMERNLFLYIAFSAACVGALALMGDFGTALIFFVTFLVMSFMRSGNLATVFLAIGSAGIAGFLVFTAKPYIAQRFATWGHVWEAANEGGYQQVRALSAAASGGFFGQGAGNGWLQDVVAADTDLVFGVVCEELGLIIGLGAILALIALAFFAVKNASLGRSSYYVIAACGAVSMMMVQLALNVFGSTDILPFTGVTFPFVSRGGSSLVSCWALLAFIKASDTRQNASFVVKPPADYEMTEEPEQEEDFDPSDDEDEYEYDYDIDESDGAYGDSGYAREDDGYADDSDYVDDEYGGYADDEGYDPDQEVDDR